MTTVFRWQNIPTVFIRHFALSLSQLKARRHSYQPVVITCPDAAPIAFRVTEDDGGVTFRKILATFDLDLVCEPCELVFNKSREILPIRFWVHELFQLDFVCRGVLNRIVGLQIYNYGKFHASCSMLCRSWAPLECQMIVSKVLSRCFDAHMVLWGAPSLDGNSLRFGRYSCQFVSDCRFKRP